MKIWGRTQPLTPYSIEDCLRTLKRVGFEGVELTFENEDIHPRKLTDEVVATVRGLIDELGLTPFSVSYHKNFIYNDDDLEDTITSIRAARRFGTDIFVYAGAPAQEGDDQAWGRMVERTRQLVQVAEEEGIILAEEFEPGFVVGSTEQLLRLFDEVPSPNLCANLDLGHMFLCDPDPIAAIHAVGDKVVHVHIENMPEGRHDHQLPQEGDMDLMPYVKALDEIGFCGGMALDLYAHDYEAVSPGAIAFIDSLRKAL